MSEPLTPEEQAIKELAGVYLAIKQLGRYGKYFAYAFAGLLTFIVLASQAWEAVMKFFHFKVG